MVEKRKTRPGAATLERVEKNTGLVTTGSICDFTTAETRVQGRIEALLHKGENNALRTCFLSAVTGLSPRQVVKEVSTERANGAPILSTCRGDGGYFLPSDGEQGQQETAACLRTMRARAIRTLQAVRDLAAATGCLDGQISINDLTHHGESKCSERR